MDQPSQDDIRSVLLNGEDRDLYVLVGYFMVWFAFAEARLTQMLSVATHSHNAERFELLIKGMDARTKCDRLRKACKVQPKLGENLRIRLLYFEDVHMKLRNRLSHSLTILAPDDRVYFTGPATMRLPFWKPHKKGTRFPHSMSRAEFMERCDWIHDFCRDLATCSPLLNAKIFEIDSPKTRLPREFLERHLPKGGRATPDMLPQTPPETQET